MAEKLGKNSLSVKQGRPIKWKFLAKGVKSLPFGIPHLLRNVLRISFSPYLWLKLHGFAKLGTKSSESIKPLIDYSKEFWNFIFASPVTRALRYADRLEDMPTDFPIEPLPKYPDEDIVVHYSGGADSSLVAVLAAQSFRKVHLLTFQHEGIKYVKRAANSLDSLKRKDGEGKFTHKIIDINSLFKKLYFQHQYPMSKFYNLLFIAPCISCRNAMHLETIRYCRNNKVKHIIDGSNSYNANLSYHEMIPNLMLTEKLYKHYGIDFHFNPCYFDIHSDDELYRLGIYKKEKVRQEYDFETYNKTQPSCYLSLLFMIGANCCLLPYHGAKWQIALAERHYRQSQKYLRQVVEGMLKDD